MILFWIVACKCLFSKCDNRVFIMSLVYRFFHNRMGKRVTLLTNDRNLAIQAMIHDIRSLSAENKVHLADFTQSLSKGQVAARHEVNKVKSA